jgi:hypothetical protein
MKYDEGIFLYNRWIATSLYHLWFDAFKPFSEPFFYSGDTLVHTINQWKKSQRSSSVPRDEIYQHNRQHLQKFECFIEMSWGITCYFPAFTGM